MSAARPRVLFVTNVAAPYRLELFRELGRRFDVLYFFFGEPADRGWSTMIAESDDGLDAVRSSGRLVLGTRVSPALVQCLRSGSFDVLVKCINGKFALLASLLVWKMVRRRPLVLWTELWSHPETLVHRMSRPLVRLLYRRADAIVAQGAHVKRFLVGEGADGDKIFEAPPVADQRAIGAEVHPTAVRALRTALDLGDRKIVLYAGRLAAEKGLEYLVDACATLEPALGTALVLVGDGPLDLTLRRRVRERGLAHVRMVPWVAPQELARYYAAADVFVLPSVTTHNLKETWGLVVNEAMHHGRAVVATTAVGAVAGGLVEDGVTGLVVPERDAAALASALARLVRDDALRDRLGARARARVAACTAGSMADAFAAAIARATGGAAC